MKCKTAFKINEGRNQKSKGLFAIDLFAGAGGLSLAARNCNIEVLAAIENDKWAQITYRHNFHNPTSSSPVVLGDITEIAPSDLLRNLEIEPGQLDILMGGPPCQGFSAHRINGAGVGDPRNNLLLRYFEFVRRIRPKAFVVENVPGLIWPRHAEYLTKFSKMVAQNGYQMIGPQILNARDYGVPQNRKRVFIVGLRKDLELDFQWPEPTHFDPKTIKKHQMKKKHWLPAKVVFQKKIKSLECDENAVHMNHTSELVDVFKSTPINGGSRKDSNRVLPCHSEHSGHKDVYGRIDPSKPGPTMTTACVNPSKGRFVHPVEHHGITVRHAARFQTFPETFTFKGGLIASAKQIGNAVPILLGEIVLSSIRNTILRGGKS